MTGFFKQLLNSMLLPQQDFSSGPDLRVPNPERKRSGDLQPQQLSWLRSEVHGFAVDEKQAKRARAHTERSRRLVKP